MESTVAWSPFRCPTCGKLTFPTRKRARRHGRKAHPGERVLNGYRCPVVTGWWHYGHVSWAGRRRARQFRMQAQHVTPRPHPTRHSAGALSTAAPPPLSEHDSSKETSC